MKEECVLFGNASNFESDELFYSVMLVARLLFYI